MPASSSRVNLYFAVCSVNIGAFAVGNGLTWTSPTLPKLQAADSWLHLHGDEVSWIGSLASLGAAVGPFPGGYLANKFGRKYTCYIAVATEVLSWILLLFATSVNDIYIARVIAGIAAGLIYAVVPLYVGEIAEDSVRGALGSLLSLSACSGYLMVYCVGPYVSYNVLIYCSLIAPIMFVILFPFVPESPYYLLQKGRKAEALANLTWLRKGRTQVDVEKELHTIQLTVEEQMRNTGKLLDLVATPSNRYALMLSCSAMIFQQFSGINVVLFYSQMIFDMTRASISSSISTIIVGAILVAAGASAPPFAKYFGIKYMFMASALGMAIFQPCTFCGAAVSTSSGPCYTCTPFKEKITQYTCNMSLMRWRLQLYEMCIAKEGILGFYFYLESFGPMDSLNWLPISSLVCYICVYSVGFGPLPWALVAETFPSNVKPTASAVSASLNWGVSFILTRYFKNVSDLLGTYSAFCLFSVFCIGAFFYSYYLVPDTRGKSLQEIQDILSKHSNK